MTRRRLLLGAGIGLALVGAGLTYRLTRFPPDTVPEGAYLRITYSLSRGDVAMVFPYLEDAAQHAAFTIRDYRKQSRDLASRSFPEPERTRLVEEYRVHADAPDGADVFVDMATRRGWIGRLRKDLSAVASVEIEGERATVVTVRGTRYPFRRRENGIWGLTLFTAELVTEAETAARDWDVVQRAAADYARSP
ncbi:MAG: hypothetical protein HOV80_35105 [Polyangiaceae bacterium]|nr:hypothetical protein [Polyangiaceae bacterium]